MKVNPATQQNQEQFRALDARASLAPGQDIRAIEPTTRGINRRFFFDTVRVLLFDGKLTPSQVTGMTAVLDEWEYRRPDDDDRKLAYMLATAHHETDRQMQPIDEYGKGLKQKYGKRVKINGKAYTDTKAIFYGRGLVQLTWWDNYRRAGLELFNDARIFLDKPEKVNELPNAVRIMFAGMSEGWFTGKKLADYFAPKREDWYNARRIINGVDRAELVKSYALKYYAAISYTTA